MTRPSRSEYTARIRTLQDTLRERIESNRASFGPVIISLRKWSSLNNSS